MSTPTRKPELLLRGMHGMGDNIHQRAVVRQKMETYDVYLTGSSALIYHDLIPQGLKVVKVPTPLLYQSQNAVRSEEDRLFWKGLVPKSSPENLQQQIWYQSDRVNRLGSVLAAMCETTKVSFERADFSLPIPDSWYDRMFKKIVHRWNGKPILLYRPLIERSDWGGCRARNPDPKAYYELFQSIRGGDKFYVISLARLSPSQEWISPISIPIKADLEFHQPNDLHFEELAALYSIASLSYSSPGFAAPLAQSVGTPNVVVFGGFEKPFSFTGGSRHAPHLSIGPKDACGCWRHNHDCPKQIDMPEALEALQLFVAANTERVRAHDGNYPRHARVA